MKPVNTLSPHQTYALHSPSVRKPLIHFLGSTNQPVSPPAITSETKKSRLQKGLSIFYTYAIMSFRTGLSLFSGRSTSEGTPTWGSNFFDQNLALQIAGKGLFTTACQSLKQWSTEALSQIPCLGNWVSATKGDWSFITDATVAEWLVNPVREESPSLQVYDKVLDLHRQSIQRPESLMQYKDQLTPKMTTFLQCHTRNAEHVKRIEAIMDELPYAQKIQFSKVFQSAFFNRDEETLNQLNRLNHKGYHLIKGSVDTILWPKLNQQYTEREEKLRNALNSTLTKKLPQYHWGPGGGNLFLTSRTHSPEMLLNEARQLFETHEPFDKRPIIQKSIKTKEDLYHLDKQIYETIQKEGGRSQAPIALVSLSPDASLPVQNNFWLYGTMLYDSPSLDDVNQYASDKNETMDLSNVLYVFTFKKPTYNLQNSFERGISVNYNSLFESRTGLHEI